MRTGAAMLLSLLTTALWSQNVNVDFRQSANNDAGYGPGAIHWISSILQSGNSSYSEGMSTLQRIVLLDVPATAGDLHSLQFGHQFTKGGHHAYDFLTGNSLGAATGWNVAYANYNSYLTDNGVTAESIIDAWECAEEIGPPADMDNICADLHDPAIGYFYDVELPNDPYISVNGLVQDKIDAYEAINGNRYIRVYGNQPITDGYFTCVEHDVPNLGDDGDSYANYILVVETASTDIIIEVAGHLAMGGFDNTGMNWGPNLGAGSISGGPHHFKLFGLGGAVNTTTCTLNEFVSLGAQDNQITAGDIIPITCTCSIEGSAGPVCPNSTNQYCAPENAVTSTWSISGNGSISGSGNCIQVIAGSGCGQSYTLTLSFTNDEGCTSECDVTVMVEDTSAPVIGALPASSTIACDESPAFAQATASDDCDNNVSLTYSDVTNPGSCAGSYSVVRTWTATDDCGNSSSASQTINVQDITAPVIDALPAASTINCPAMPEFAQASASDACGEVELSFEDVTSAGSCAGNYSVTRTWTAADACGNTSSASQTINVQDVTAPIIVNALPDQFIQCEDEAVYNVPSFSDACDNSLDVSYEVDTIILDRGSRIVRRFTATDDCGNSVTDESEITIAIEENPVLLNLPEPSLVVECGNIPEAVILEGRDVCGNNLQVNFEEVISGDNCNGTVTRTWTVIDEFDNDTTFTQVITVVDTTSPVISAAGANATIECPEQPNFTAPTATDSCNDVQVVEVSDITEEACGNTYSRTKTWKAIDACGNESGTVSQTITVVDNTAPVISAAGANTSVECPNTPEFTAPTASDECGSTEVVVVSDETTSACGNTYSRTISWKAIDACGNESGIVSQTISVVDTTAPSISAAGENATIECPNTPEFTAPTAADDCGTADVVVVSDETTPACGNTYSRTISWKAVDACGNESDIVSQTISVADTTAPVFETLTNLTVNCTEGAGLTEAIATDNCSDVELTYVDEITCDYTTYSKGGLGSPSNSTPGQYRDNNFDGAFPNGLTIGCEIGSYTFTNAQAIEDFLPSGGGALVLPAGNVVNPDADIVSNNFADQLIAAMLNTGFDAYDENLGDSNVDLGNLTYASGTFAGMSVYAVIEIANDVIGGCSNAYSPTALLGAMEDVNLSFHEGGESSGALNCGFEENECSYTVIRTWTATDACGNSSEAIQTLTVTDNDAPVISAAGANQVIACPAVPVFTAPTATDNCSQAEVIVISDVTTEGECSYVRTITWAAEDECGNRSESVSQSITVIDDSAPVFTSCPANITINCSDDMPAVAENVNATDNCSDVVNVEYMGEVVASEGCNSTITRTWVASDLCGNSAACVQVITLVDTIAPVFNAYEIYTHVTCSEVPSALTATDNCGDVTVELIQELVQSGTCPGVIHRIYEATDECGNTAQAEQFISIMDTIAPVLVGVPANNTIECSDVTLNNDGDVTATDDCGQAVVLTYSEEIVGQDDDCPETYDIIRTWVATDACNNTATETRTTHVEDTTAPEFINFPADITISCDDEIPAVESPTALDNCDGEVEYAMTQDQMPGSCPQSYFIYRTFRGYDNCGNERVETQTITVVDETAPVFDVQASSFSYECNTEIPVIQPTASDNCGVVTFSYIDAVPSVEGPACAVPMQRVWIATDECGNSSEFTQTITIVDTQAPVVNPYTVEIEMPCDAVSNEIMISAQDCNEVIITFSDEHVSGSCAGRIIRTYSVSDACGNVTSGLIQQIINLIDVTGPAVEVAPVDVTIDCGETAPAYQPVWTDNCAEELEFAAASSISADDCTTVINESWTAVDPCGNSTTVSRTITIVDSTAPVFTSVPSSEERDCNEDDVVASAYADDNCSDVTITRNDVIVPGLCTASYTIERTYTATDACGNSSSYTQMINVSDNNGPVWGENQTSFVYECGSDAAVVTPAASDDCSEFTMSYDDGDSFEYGCTVSFERTWLAVDACGNASAPFVQYISFEDTTEPVLSGCPTDLVLNCNDEVPAPAQVTAFDGCDADVQVYFEEVFVGDAPAEGSIADCNLLTPARPAGNPCGYPYDWAMAMFSMPSAHRWYQVVDGSLIQYPGGSMHLEAQLQNVLAPGTGWNVDVWFNGGMDWSAWSTQGFPTSFKADCGGVDANFASWTYFLLQAGPGAELTGYGNYEGSVMNLVHAPSNNYFGYQLGDGANNYNAADNSFGGWFSYSGTFRSNVNNAFTNVTGAGDFAFELDCCPDYTIERQWMAVDCSGNTSTCTQTISFSSNASSNGGNDGQSTINSEAVSNERLSSTITVAPNPANNTTVFTFKAAHSAKTSIEVFDMTGKKVADVFMGGVEAGASYNVNFNVSDLATGVYTYRLTNGSDVKIDRLIINK